VVVSIARGVVIRGSRMMVRTRPGVVAVVVVIGLVRWDKKL
jgi:hypothetical protein